MKLELPDNAREAFQFLALGLVCVVLIRLGYAGLEALFSPDEGDRLGQFAAPFRRGYLAIGAHTIVPDGMSTMVRLSLAVVLGIAGGAAGALLSFVLRAISRKQAARVHWGVVRLCLFGITGIGIVSALFLPPRRIEIASSGITLLERPALLGTSFPFPASKQFYAWGQVHVWNNAQHDRGVWLVLDTPSGEQVIEHTSTDAEADSLYFWMAHASAQAFQQ